MVDFYPISRSESSFPSPSKLDVSMSKSLTISFSPNPQGFNCITSIQVADLFEREHKDVLKSIASLVRKEEIGERICAPTSYLDSWNRKQQMYLLTESGFMVLMSSSNLRTKKQKETRNEILKLFQERSQQLIKRNLQLENVVTKRREAKGIYGHILEWIEGKEYPKVTRVLREGCSYLELLRGKIGHMKNVVFGMQEKISVLEKEASEIEAEQICSTLNP